MGWWRTKYGDRISISCSNEMLLQWSSGTIQARQNPHVLPITSSFSRRDSMVSLWNHQDYDDHVMAVTPQKSHCWIAGRPASNCFSCANFSLLSRTTFLFFIQTHCQYVMQSFITFSCFVDNTTDFLWIGLGLDYKCSTFYVLIPSKVNTATF